MEVKGNILRNLTERYGCVAGLPSGIYAGSKAMTRFEAAALLNACLDRVVDSTDALKRLLKLPLAHKAPRAHHIGHHIDPDRAFRHVPAPSPLGPRMKDLDLSAVTLEQPTMPALGALCASTTLSHHGFGPWNRT